MRWYGFNHYLFAPIRDCTQGDKPQSEVMIRWECNFPAGQTCLSNTSVPSTAVLCGLGYLQRNKTHNSKHSWDCCCIKFYFLHWFWATVSQEWLNMCSFVQIFILPISKNHTILGWRFFLPFLSPAVHL